MPSFSDHYSKQIFLTFLYLCTDCTDIVTNGQIIGFTKKGQRVDRKVQLYFNFIHCNGSGYLITLTDVE